MPKNTTQHHTAGSLRSPALKTPKLRFPGFDGVWEEKKLGEVSKFSTERISVAELNKNNFIGVDNLLSNLQGKTESQYLPKTGKVSKFSKGDILHSNIRPYLKKAWRADIEGGSSADVLVIHPIDNIDSLFLYRQITSDSYFDYVMSGAKGVKMPRGDKNHITEFSFCVPQLPEQQKIASFLGEVDALIENLREQKKSLESYKKSLMQKIFSQQIRFKDEKGNDFPEWEEKRLGEVFSGEKGTGLSKEKIIENGGYECILYGELYTTYKEIIFDIKSKTNIKEGLLSKIGDLLVPCSTTTTGIDLANITALNKEGVLLGGDITVLRGKKEINNIFYAYYLSNFKKTEIARYAQGVTIIHLYYSHFKNMMIDVPSLPEQQKIAEFLSSVDTLLESKQQQITKAEEWKKGLMQRLFV